MKKILLLTTTVLLFVLNANAACNPNLPACQCSYPEMKNGIIGCIETYCETGTKCMPDGSCCPCDNYCECTEKEKQCCSAEQTCDTTKGCVEKKADIETLCANVGGYIWKLSSGVFCEVPSIAMDWYDASKRCQKSGMTMPTMSEMCPSWDGNGGAEKCPELWGYHYTWGGSATASGTDSGVNINTLNGFVEGCFRDNTAFYLVLCH